MRVSGTSGQRYDSVSALKAASANYIDRANLRDELIACLALPDLKANTSRYCGPEDTSIYELNPDGQVGAYAETGGTVVIQSLDEGKPLRSLDGFGANVVRLRFGRDPGILLAEYRGSSSTRTMPCGCGWMTCL